MTSYHYDRERSTLRECVAFLKRIKKPAIIEEIAAGVNFSQTACYRALKTALREGYVKNGEKRKYCDGSGNLKMTYLPTEKQLPPPKAATDKAMKAREYRARRAAALKASNTADFVPFRDPFDEIFFGTPALVLAASEQISARIYRMDMTVTADEMEAMT